MRLELLHYFVQIVESRSFNKAAARLFLTQPALTNAMNALEGELGTRLLVRSHKASCPRLTGPWFTRTADAYWENFANAWKPGKR